MSIERCLGLDVDCVAVSWSGSNVWHLLDRSEVQYMHRLHERISDPTWPLSKVQSFFHETWLALVSAGF